MQTFELYRHSDAVEPIASVDAECLADALDAWLDCDWAIASSLLFVDDLTVVDETDGRLVQQVGGGVVRRIYVCYHPLPTVAARYGRKSIIKSYKGGHQ